MKPETSALSDFIIFKRYAGIINDFNVYKSLRRLCNRFHIQISDNELQSFADNYREEEGLIEVEQFNEWAASIDGFTVEHFESFLRHELSVNKLEEHLITPEKVNLFFEENKWRYYHFALSKISVLEHTVSEELYDVLINERRDFHQLAKQLSVATESRSCGGRIGTIPSYLLGFELADHIIHLKGPGSFTKPFHSGLFWNIYYLEDIAYPVADQKTVTQVKKDILLTVYESEFDKE